MFKDIEYNVIGESSFDEFFLESAKLNGLVTASKAFINQTVKSLKNTAMDEAASAQMESSIKEIVGDKPKEEWTVQETLAVNRLLIEKGKVSSDIVKGYIETGKDGLLLAGSLVKGSQSVPKLIKKGKSLSSKASQLSPTKVPAATSAVATSLDNLKEASEKLPTLAEDIKVLSEGLKEFSEL